MKTLIVTHSATVNRNLIVILKIEYLREQILQTVIRIAPLISNRAVRMIIVIHLFEWIQRLFIMILLNSRHKLNLLLSAQIECDKVCRCNSGYGKIGGKDLGVSGMCHYWCSPIGAIIDDGSSYCGIGPSFIESNRVKGTDCRTCHAERHGTHFNYVF